MGFISLNSLGSLRQQPVFTSAGPSFPCACPLKWIHAAAADCHVALPLHSRCRKDEFVAAKGPTDAQMAAAGRAQADGSLQLQGGRSDRKPERSVEEWRPVPMLCRRFNCPDPYQGRAPVAPVPAFPKFQTEYVSLPETDRIRVSWIRSPAGLGEAVAQERTAQIQ